MAQNAQNLPRYLQSLSSNPAKPLYRCNACRSKPMTNYDRHSNSEAHKRNVERWLAEEADNEEILGTLSHAPAQSSSNNEWPEDAMETDEEADRLDDSILQVLELLGPALLDESDSSDSESETEQRQLLYQALEMLDNEGLDDEDDPQYEALLDAELANAKKEEAKGWFPFKKKEHVVAILIIGTTRNLLSRSQYHRIRAIVRICSVYLPEWGVVRALKKRLKERFGLSIVQRMSPLGTPLFGPRIEDIIRRDLANPFISPHIVTIPEQTAGTNNPITCLSQSSKWLKEFDREIRAQMVESPIGHIYIYEIYQLRSKHLMVPTHFFQQDGKLFAKCLQATVIPRDKNFNEVAVHIPQEPDFDSPSLHTIEISLLSKNFGQIKIEGLGFLKNVLKDKFIQSKGQDFITLPLVNPWRSKANGKIIKHIPLTLYSDDTSGNVSKKWNKHMSLFFTLSGLPPDMTNQEYNIHFLGTSNRASALELYDNVVDELNNLSEVGFEAFDYSSRKEVIAMVVVLCHLGDSPMHTEICNTMNPAITLTPCRICPLQVDTMVEKKTEKFIQQFVGLDSKYKHNVLPKRDWAKTRSQTIEIWEAAKKPNSKTLVEQLGRKYGIRDSTCDHFIKRVQLAYQTKPRNEVHEICRKLDNDLGDRLFNPMLRLKGFDGHSDTPVEILHVVLLGIVKYLFRDTMKELGTVATGSEKYNDLSARWHAFNTKGLNIPPIQPNTLIQYSQSLVGKEFQTVLQTIPFVLFGHLSAQKRHLWTSLCLLSSYVFQSRITKMDSYLVELQSHISLFLHQLIRITAQWVNKPKFHMLTHLPGSIRRLGPATLFATQKFESFNGVLRYASIHSNHQSPGQDIANTFNNWELLKMFTSKSPFYDRELDEYVTAGPKLNARFPEHSEIQHALGLDIKSTQRPEFIAGKETQATSRAAVPSYLLNIKSEHSWEEIVSLTLLNKQKVETSDFVLMIDSRRIGQVQSIWKPANKAASRSLLLVKKSNQNRVIPFYGMREIVIQEDLVWIKATDIDCILNVQHNCHEASCSVTDSHQKRVERMLVSQSSYAITHNPLNSYIINAGALYSAEAHRRASALAISTLTPEQWKEAVLKGLEVWDSAPPPPPPKSRKKKTTT